MKLFVISGLGADRKIFDKITFPENFSEIVFIDWLLPEPEEDFYAYVKRMAAPILQEQEKFCLLGYSFGGILVQEIHRMKKAEKVVILGSIKSHHEKNWPFLWAKKLRFSSAFAERYLNEEALFSAPMLKKVFAPGLKKYFTVKDPYYLKWSLISILEWESEAMEEVVQIMAEKDLVFPPRKAHPQYIIRNASHLFPVTKAREVSELLQRELGGL